MEINDKTLSRVTNEDIVNGTINIPEGVTEIGVCAFRDCMSLKSITIPNNVISIGSSAFDKCIYLESIAMSDSVTSINHDAFFDCTSLKSITIPNSVTEIGSRAFYNCISLKNIEIPNSVTKIGGAAFFNCTSLESVTIPDSIKILTYSAFNRCNSLNLNILTSLFYFDRQSHIDNDFLSVNSITVYGQKINKNKFEQELDNVRRKELLDKISIYLKNNNVTDTKCYELSEHKDFIETTICNFKNVDGYKYRDDFDGYMSKYILSTMSIYDDKQMEQIFSALNNHQVEPLDSSNAHSIVKYGSGLEQYPNYLAGIYQLIVNHYGLDSSMINMKKTIAEMSKPQNLVQLITTVFDSYNGGPKYYLNKRAVSQLEQFADVNITKLMYGIEKAEKLKVAVEVYIGKADGYVKNLSSYDFTQTNEQSLLPNAQNPISIKEDVDKNIELYQASIASMMSLYHQINDFTVEHADYVMKLQGAKYTLLPGVKTASSLGKGIVRTRKNIKMLEDIVSIYEEMIEASKGNADNQNAEAKGKI